MTNYDKILKLITKNKGYIRTKEVEDNGISRKYLTLMEKEGKIERIKRGLYRGSDYINENEISEIIRIVPGGVICLETAAEYYGLPTIIPTEYSVAIFNYNEKSEVFKMNKKIEEKLNELKKIKEDKKGFSNWKLANTSNETDYKLWAKCINEFDDKNFNVLDNTIESIGE